ncbi:MAG: hypothetical protein ISR64_03295 [Deltaproteobacteria bacterium]|nr:hypothetical protein [Deltaproteobacteria bacterium]
MLLAYLQGPKVCYWKDETLGRLTGLSESDVRKYRKRLLLRGLLAPAGKGWRATLPQASPEALKAHKDVVDGREWNPSRYPEVYPWVSGADGVFVGPLAFLRNLEDYRAREFWGWWRHHLRKNPHLKKLEEPVAGAVVILALRAMADNDPGWSARWTDPSRGLATLIRKLSEDELGTWLANVDDIRKKVRKWKVDPVFRSVRDEITRVAGQEPPI